MVNPNNENLVEVELTSGTVFRSFLNKSICKGDNNANVYGMYLFKDGNPVNPTGICTGYFIRPDKTTVAIQGQIEGNKAYVTLPASCYITPGQFSLAIKVTNGQGFTVGIRIVDGTVIDTTTETLVDPGSVIPSLADLLAVIEQAEAAAEEIDTLIIEAVPLTGFTDLYRIDVTYGGES